LVAQPAPRILMPVVLIGSSPADLLMLPMLTSIVSNLLLLGSLPGFEEIFIFFPSIV
jgi:hypothetical protein